jgi:hypothetical protein
MRRVLLVLLAVTAVLFGGAAVANANTGYSTGVCIKIYGPVDQVIYRCFAVKVTLPPPPEPNCPDCALMVDFGLHVLPPEVDQQVAADIQAGIQGLGAAAVATDPNQAGQLHANAVNAFTSAATALNGTTLPAPTGGLLDQVTLGCWPWPDWWDQSAGEFSHGISMTEQFLANRDPSMWDAIIPMYDQAYRTMATGGRA